MGLDIILALGGETPPYFTFPRHLLEDLRRRFPQKSVALIDPKTLPDVISEAEALLCWQLPEEALARAKKLRLLMYAADGLGPKRLYPALISAPVQVTNSRGVRAQAIAEHALGALLGLSRRLFFARDLQRQKVWGKGQLIEAPLPMELYGETLVVVGVGEVGRRFALLAGKGLGARVVGVRARPEKGAPEGVAQVVAPAALKEVLPEAAAVVLALPPTPDTQGILDAEGIALLRPGAFVVNVGRGSSIDQEALLAALQAGRLGGAALDVFAEEPLPPASPLWDLPQVLVTPHYSGVTPALWPRLYALFAENVRRLYAGEPLINLVDKERGY